MGTESVVQNSRVALLDFIDTLPDDNTMDETQFTLRSLANCLVSLLKVNVDNDRVLPSVLEVIAFLFDMQVIQRLQATAFK
jgi:hypothetical protein